MDDREDLQLEVLRPDVLPDGIVDIGHVPVVVEVIHLCRFFVDELLDERCIVRVNVAVVIGIGERVLGLPVDVLGLILVAVGLDDPVYQVHIIGVDGVASVGVAEDLEADAVRVVGIERLILAVVIPEDGDGRYPGNGDYDRGGRGDDDFALDYTTNIG